MKPWVSRAVEAVKEHLVLGRCWVGIARQRGARRDTLTDDGDQGRGPRLASPSAREGRGAGRDDARPGRKSSDKEDFIAAEKLGMRSREFDQDQDRPRH